MVFNIFQRLFSKKSKITGDIWIDDKPHLRNTEMEHIEGTIRFNKSNESLLLSHISDLTISYEPKIRLDFSYTEDSIIKIYSFFPLTKNPEKELQIFYDTIAPLVNLTKYIFKKGDIIYSIFNTSVCGFEEVESSVEVKIIQEGETYFLRIENSKETIHFEEITTETQFYMDQKNKIFVWSINKDGIFQTFAITFPDNISFLEFLSKYSSCTYKNPESEYEKMEIENYKEESEELSQYSEIEFEDEFREESCEVSFEKEEKNSLLVVGNSGHAFVSRGASIGVFNVEGGDLKFKTNIKNVMKNDMSKMVGFDNGKSLLISDDSEKDKIHKLDLECGKIAETWEIGRDMSDYFESNKLSNDGTLVGVSSQALFRIDPRVKEKIVSEKVYKTNNQFSCGMSTRDGEVAVASRKGDLRLYDKIDRRAKSLLPGFGDEIRGIDVTSNGKYIICTCKTYLMLIEVEGKFKTPIGKDKPIPKKLQLKPEHLAYINEEVSFTPAKFSTDKAEESIVTSTGHYVITWNLEDVIKGRVYSYRIKKYGDKIVADNFGFGEDESIIVALPDDIKLAHKTAMKKPESFLRYKKQ
ncbi:Vacuolar import and degradation protein 27 [Astathelohania contejeani]|uniref:Vacuolar import and degradation protein 27 n=1 Tax=Astathelohania contejeani TaxID=164912 RepID=A0ABQ7HWW4_9MICR|nr:Vacuolar import and degradation protein 27 [Thelohania contejeani]